jgi:hypothetical protein
MASVSRLGKQIEEVVATLNAMGAQFALIGGLALASHKVIRATQDVDLLTDGDIADQIDTALTKLGYRRAHRSSEAANCLRGDERVDFLFASRPIARRLLIYGQTTSTSPERRYSAGECCGSIKGTVTGCPENTSPRAL